MTGACAKHSTTDSCTFPAENSRVRWENGIALQWHNASRMGADRIVSYCRPDHERAIRRRCYLRHADFALLTIAYDVAPGVEFFFQIFKSGAHRSGAIGRDR
jgi:hypothetical protein